MAGREIKAQGDRVIERGRPTLVKTGRLDTFALVLQGSRLLDLGQGRDVVGYFYSTGSVVCREQGGERRGARGSRLSSA